MKRSLLFLSLLAPVLLYAQTNFLKGYVVTNSGDTLKGYVDYRERELNPVSFNFKSQLDSKAQVVTLQNTVACVINDLDSYQRFLVDITTSTTDISNLPVGPDARTRRDTVFLKVVQTGKKITLYTYRDPIKLRFYVRENSVDEPSELIRQIYSKGDQGNTMVIGNTYNRQLAALMYRLNPAKATKLSLYWRYTEQDLNKAVALINDQELIKSKYKATRFFAGVALSRNMVVYGGDNALSNDDAISKVFYTPLITAGIDVFVNPAIQKVVFRTELSFMTSKNQISTTTGDRANAALSHSFNQYSVVLSPQIIYNIYNGSKLKAFIGAGFGFNLSKYSNNVFTRYNSFRDETEVIKDNIELEKFNFSIPLTAGMLVHKNIEIVAHYYMPTSVTNYNTYNVKIKRFSIGVSYLFH